MTPLPGKKPIKLLYVVHSLNLGGAEKLAVKMAQAFSHEFDVTVVCLDEPGIWAGELRRMKIPVYCLWRQPGLDLSVSFKLAEFARTRGVDIIHAHQTSPWFYSSLSRIFHSKPRLLFEEHGRHYPEVENKKKVVVNRLFVIPLTHRVVAVSEDVKKHLVRYEGVPEEKIAVIYNGVDLPRMISPGERQRIREQLGIGDRNFLIGTVGRFDPIKNLPLLVKAIKHASQQVPEIRAVFIGDGPCLDEVKELRNRLNLTDILHLPGYRSDASSLVQALDLFVLSSFSEGTSMALLEAMAYGIPVVVTDVGGNPEIVLAGETGWVVPSNSLSDLTAAILDAALNPEKSEKFGLAGKQRFERYFTFEKMIQNYHRVYGELMNGESSKLKAECRIV